MEQNIKRSETKVIVDRDDWVDEAGKLHTKITREIITGPLDNVQASRRIEEPLFQRMIRPLRHRPRLMIQGVPVQLPQVPQIQPQQGSQAQQQQNQPQPKAPLDIGALMTMGKKLLDESGIDFKDLLSKAMSPESLEEEPETLSDKKEVEDKTWQKKTKKLKPQKKQLKIKKKIQMKSKKD